MKNWSKRTIILSILAILGVTSLAFQPTDIYFLIKKNFTIFSETYENVALEYVDEVDPEVLMRNGMKAMLETLDPYTVFYDESQNEQAEILSRSNYAGIGIEAGYREGEVVIVAPTEGGPADQKGIRAGDIILSIDGVSTSDLQPEEVQNLTMGEIGSSVILTIKRFGFEQPLEFELTRANIEIKNVTYSGRIGENDELGYIRLAQFGMNSGNEIRTALLEMQEENELIGLVLDLRDNPGGILGEAVSIIDKFVEPGITVVETRGRIAEYNQSYETQEPIMFNRPVVILMSEGSASASEVVAGALQDLDRAVILGEQSFGKGLVQIVKPLPYNTSLKITISRYYTPSGRSIQSVEYTHNARNASLSRAEIANRVFETRNGRPVKEGRGVEPDVESPIQTPGILQTALFQEGSYFNFATQYESENEIFSDTELSQDVFADFEKFLDETSFDFKTESEFLLDELVASLEETSNSQEYINGLREEISKEKAQLFEANTELIKQTLFLELLSRYEGQTAKIEAGFSFDPQLREAIDILGNQELMNRILTGLN